ncbi:MAG: addiction module protein [Chloracidobacterium sp.]|nr:addiction module protein [Chloracidobacterium sp.]
MERREAISPRSYSGVWTKPSPNFSPEEIEQLWITEAESRYEEWESDPSVGIPGDRALREAREALKR